MVKSNINITMNIAFTNLNNVAKFLKLLFQVYFMCFTTHELF